MKTKHRILSVLTILALVASLTAVMAAPAGAIAGFTVVTISDDVITRTGVVYTLRFIPTRDIEDAHVITVIFPEGFGLTLIGPGDVRIEGVAPDSFARVGQMLIVSPSAAAAATLRAGMPADIEVGVTGAGTVTNPVIPGIYRLRVRTTAEPTDVESGAFTIRGFRIYPISAAVGAAVTAHGAGFVAGQTVWIFDDAAPFGVIDPGETVFATGVVGTAGVFSIPFTVTAALAGRVSARDGTGRSDMDIGSPHVIFTVVPVPTMTLDTPVVPRGGMVQFDGAGLTVAAGIPIEMRFDAVGPTFSLTGETSGATSFANATIPMPFAAPLGSQRVTFMVGANTAWATITVVPSIVSITPPSGPIGTTVSVTGSDLAPGVLYRVWFDTDRDTVIDANETPVEATATADGRVSMTFAIPVGASGATPVALVAPGDIPVVFTSFTVPAAAITLSPTRGVPGTEVTVTGIGFPRHSVLDLLTIGPATVTPIPSVITDDVGRFTARFVVPGIGVGAHVVNARAGGITDPETFTITAEVIPVGVALRGIEAVLRHSVWSFDNVTKRWSQHLVADPGAVPAAVRLTTLEAHQPYWVYVTANTTLVFGGHSYSLTAGWNIIAWRG
ncbi:MAG: hypothetical protein DDT25_01078 [Chloroflexi bacterium]|nr:hypothetical protein [Chloroflexota bacterium]